MSKLFACVVSKHNAVKTCFFKLKTGIRTKFPKPISTEVTEPLEENSLFIDHIITESRKLLYDVYVQEIKWVPKRSAPTKFIIEDGQLKDRFDEVGVWVCIINELSIECKVLGVMRNLSGKLGSNDSLLEDNDCADLDVTSYDTSPAEMKKWVSERGAKNVMEIQRFAVTKKHRSSFLPIHLLCITADLFDDPEQKVISSQNMFVISTVYSKTIQKYIVFCGGKKKPEWSFKYDPEVDKSDSVVMITDGNNAKKKLDKFVRKVL